MDQIQDLKKEEKVIKINPSGCVHTKNQLYTHQNMIVSLRLMFCLLILGMRLPLGHIQARV